MIVAVHRRHVEENASLERVGMPELPTVIVMNDDGTGRIECHEARWDAPSFMRFSRKPRFGFRVWIEVEGPVTTL